MHIIMDLPLEEGTASKQRNDLCDTKNLIDFEKKKKKCSKWSKKKL